jgi:hypothetical protein
MRARTLIGPSRCRHARALCSLVALASALPAYAQDVGHKLVGTLGLRAGAQAPTGFYVTDRFIFYTADDLFDRNGKALPQAFDLEAVANAVAVSGSYRLPRLATYVNATVAVPVAHVTATAAGVTGSVDRFGLADAYIQPLKLGWRAPHLDAQLGYAFYVPTGRLEPGGRGGVSRGAWSHELSFGGTVYGDRARTWRLSALTSYEVNAHKLGIDLKRGSTIQIQGGAGKTLFHFLDIGLTGYALWQVSDDGGRALPSVLRGVRDRVYGIGTEVDVTVAEAHSRVTVRYSHDLDVTSRPLGQLLLLELSFFVWQETNRR